MFLYEVLYQVLMCYSIQECVFYSTQSLSHNKQLSRIFSTSYSFVHQWQWSLGGFEHLLSIRSLGIAVSLTMWNAGCSLHSVRRSFKQYNIGSTCFFTIYDFSWQCNTLVEKCIVWMSKKSRNILSLGSNTRACIQYQL